MASNLSTIGFVFPNPEAFRDTMLKCAGEITAQQECGTGAYGIWRSRTGAEIWFHLGRADNGEVEILGLTPFFEGQSDVLLKISQPVLRDGDNSFEGALTGWVSPENGSEGSYPIQFDAVDFAAHANATWPDLRRVRLTSFARELQAFPSDAAYYAARGTPDEEHPKLSAHAFIPLGIFASAVESDGDNDNNAQTPDSSALLTGTILDHRTYTNEVSGAPFVWLLVESLEATFDIVADPAIIKGELVNGGTIEAAVIMFGRLLPDTATAA